jgi:hypothetical protein
MTKIRGDMTREVGSYLNQGAWVEVSRTWASGKGKVGSE